MLQFHTTTLLPIHVHSFGLICLLN